MKFESTDSSKHKPVLLQKLVELLYPKKGEIVIDCTSGMGGHAEAFIKKIGKNGIYTCIDQDQEALSLCRKNLSSKFKDYQIRYKNINFQEIGQSDISIDKADIVISDLGISSYQLDTETRGFSFKIDGPLDMRMNQNMTETAESIVNSYTERELLHIFLKYGEIPYQSAKTISRNIASKRIEKKISTTSELRNIIKESARKLRKEGTIETLAFQAIRIELNNELDSLQNLLDLLHKKMKVGSRIGIISFHSLEDRIVKKFFKYWSQECVCDKTNPICVCKKENKKRFKLLNKKPITPDPEELLQNPRSRSAKLRGVQVVSI